jgi:hypothetical protein
MNVYVIGNQVQEVKARENVCVSCKPEYHASHQTCTEPEGADREGA